MPPQGPISEPFPIFFINGSYLLYDVDVISHVRSRHHMVGVLTGTLAQCPQQNVFLGIPLQLMTEEAALLVEKGAAYVVDDVEAHDVGLKAMLEADRNRYLKELEEERNEVASRQKAMAEGRKRQALKKKGIQLDAAESAHSSTPAGLKDEDVEDAEEKKNRQDEDDSNVAAAADKADSALLPAAPSSLRYYTIPSASSPIFHAASPSPHPSHKPSPNPSSYPLFKHFHELNFFIAPALRFGAQFMAYPGDPLRFHSHFVVNGYGYDEEFDVLDMVAGGRLGTGVKKAWMFGGQEPGGKVRSFCVEWAGF